MATKISVKNSILFIFILGLFSCNKSIGYKDLETECGCLNNVNKSINFIPAYLSSEEFISYLTVENGYELVVYEDDKSTVSDSVKTGYYLSVLKNGNKKRSYKLNVQDLYSEVQVEVPSSYGEILQVPMTSSCDEDIQHSFHTRKTVYFKAIKDSSYTIYAYSGDTVNGIGSITIRDENGNTYHEKVQAEHNAGSGWFSFPPGNPYEITSEVDGNIYIDVWGDYEQEPSVKNHLHGTTDICVTEG